MSVASTAPDSATGREDSAASATNPFEISVPLDPARSALFKIKSLQGLCPPEGATWICDASSCTDRRLLQPLTLRFQSCQNYWSEDVQNRRYHIRQAIWDAVAEIMQQKSLKGSMPAILFDDDPLDPSKAHGSLDVIFTESGLWAAMHARLKKIHVDLDGSSACEFSLVSCSNKLAGNIWTLDLLRLPLTSANSEAILQSLNEMMAGIGTVTGLATVTHQGSDKSFTYAPDCHRAYLKLHEASMTISFHILIEKLPTHFVWEGVPLPMYYTGRILHKTPLHSASFPTATSSSAGQNDHSSASPSASTSDNQSSTAGASNEQASKRKRNDE